MLDIAEYQTSTAVFDKVTDEMSRQAKIDRNGHETRSHDAKVNG
jgi:hypothetical protein